MSASEDFDASRGSLIAAKAAAIAGSFKHEYVTNEHLLAALISDHEIKHAINDLDGDIAQIANDLNIHLSSNALPRNSILPPRRTSSLQRVTDRAVTQAMFSGRRELRISDLIIALLQEEDSHAVYFLRKSGIDLLKVKKYFSHNEADTDDDIDEADEPPTASNKEKDNKSRAEKILRKYCTLLNEKAEEGKVDPLIGRESEVELITLILSRRYKNNPIIVGEPGVGKTQIVQGLALKINKGEVPEVLRNAQIWSLDIGAMIAGTKFRGDMEERLKNILKSIEDLNKESGKEIILFIDEIHMIMGAGGNNQGAMDVSNLIKPSLSNGELRCIGSTTYDEYRKHFEKDRALMRRFQKIDVSEPNIEDAKRIIEGLASSYEKFHNVSYEKDALIAAVDLSSRYITDRVLPDKAIDIIDLAGARQKLMVDNNNDNNNVISRVITKDMIEFEVAKIARIPAMTVQENENEKLSHLERDLHDVVFDQSEAIEQLASAIYISRAGLRESNKPLGNYLFHGRTGTGKTEVCKQLAKTLGIELVRFDMSEYMEKHTVSRLIGAPPGYVGFGDGQSGNGLLINAIEKTPHCVLLLDEIEKAAPEIFNLFLQVMDDGRLTSPSGKTINLTNIILIMTSNAGAALNDKEPIGFNKTARDGEDQKAINDLFTPEFRNRLDAIIRFNPISYATMIKIVDKFVNELNVLSKMKNVIINISDEARGWLANKGYDPKFGARPLSRVIQQNIKKPISREMLFGQLKNGGIAYVTLNGNDLQISYEEVPIIATEDLVEDTI